MKLRRLRPPAPALIFSLCSALLLPLRGAAVDIVAHRGASHDAPENTLPAFRLGWEQQADANELDIHLSQDGQIVVIHDADTRRTTGAPGKVAETPWAQLRRLEAGGWKGASWKGQPLPTLDEALATVPREKRILIEIKCGPEVLPALEQSLKRSGLAPAQTVLIGFGYETVVQAKQRFPQLTVLWLSSFKQDKDTGAWTPTAEQLIEKARAGGLDGLDLNFQALDAEFVRKVKAAGLQCHVWTVNDPAIARRMKEAGIDSITTDRPRFIREQLARP